MTDNDFFNQELIKNLLLFNIYDVDEFVLRGINNIKDSNLIDVFDIRKAKRYSFEIYHADENKYEEIEISFEEYTKRQKEGDSSCFTRLNYEEFEENFPLDMFENWYDDNWLINYHYNKAFLPTVINWIENTEGDASKKLKIRKIIRTLNKSRNSLENIKYGWYKDAPLNIIQKKVIQIFKRFNKVMLEGIKEYFINYFPEVFSKEPKKNNTTNFKIEQNHFPRIFTDIKSFNFFDELRRQICNNNKTILADYSFVFRKMQNENYIYEGISESEFRSFLSKEYEVELDKLKTLENCSPQKKVQLYDYIKLSIPK